MLKESSIVNFINTIEGFSNYSWVEFDFLNMKEPHDKSIKLADKSLHDDVSRFPLFIFLSSAILCLLCSTIFHTFYIISERASLMLVRLDYAGISILIFGSSVPILYYSFYCQPFWYQLYLTVLFFECAVVFILSLFEFFH